MGIRSRLHQIQQLHGAGEGGFHKESPVKAVPVVHCLVFTVLAVPAGEKAPTKGPVGHDAHALFMRPADSIRVVPHEHGVVSLVDLQVRVLHGLLHLFHRQVADAQMTDDLLLFQPAHGGHRFLQRHSRIRPVQEQNIDIVRAEIVQGPLAEGIDVVRLPVAHILSVHEVIARLSRDEHVFASARLFQGLSDVLLTPAAIVGRRCVDQIDPHVNGCHDCIQTDVVRVVVPAGSADSPGSVGEGGDHKTCLPK